MEFAEIKNELIERLGALGYEAQEKDEFMLNFVFNKVCEEILNITNQSAVPSELRFSLIDWVCGEFLYNAGCVGMLTDGQKEGVVKQLSMGDVSITYDENATQEAKYNALIDGMRLKPNQLIRFRRLEW